MNIDKIRRITRDGRWVPEIDGLRFLAIISVLLFHLAGELANRSGRTVPIEQRYWSLFAYIGNGDRGVGLFFVISGLILALPFARHYLAGARPVSLRKYYLRRVTRLEPPYLLSILIATLLIAGYSRGKLPPGFGWHALASAFYLHNIIFRSMSWVNPVTWSLEIEIQFYLLAPLVMQLFRIPKATPRRIAILAIALLAAAARPALLSIPHIDLSIEFCLQYFLIGLLLADLFVLELDRLPYSFLWDALGFAALALMFGLHHFDTIDIYLPFVYAAICLAALRGKILQRAFSAPWIAVIGGMCYSIYLMHLLWIAVFFKFTRYAISSRLDFLGNYLVQCIITGIPVLLVSYLFYRLVERPCMDPDWPSKLWHKLTGRSEAEVEALDTAGIS